VKNEVYYSLANTAILSPQDILRKCYVTSHGPGSPPPTSPWPLTSRGADEGEGIPGVDRFICRSAVNPQRGLFYEFTWEAHREHAKAAPPGDWSRWDVGVSNTVPETPKPKTRIAKKRKADLESDGEESDSSLPPSPSKRPKPARKPPARSRPPAKKKPRTKTILEDEEFEPEPSKFSSPSGSSAHPSDASDAESDAPVEPADSDFDLNDNVPRTPSKRKRGGQTSATTTPRHKRIRNLAMPTPHSKAALRARRKKAPLFVKPPPPEMNDEHYKQLQKLPKDSWLRGMHVLHVAARPNELPCRGEEYARVLRSVLELVEEGSGGCVCESELGVPL
jgi:origin recognition complex subunit 1